MEAQHQLQPNNEARIAWHYDSLQQATEYVLVYLHDGSASQEKSNPTHRDMAKGTSFNSFIPPPSEFTKK